MKIISINIENNKHISVFYAKLDGRNLIISGDTGTGKTTVISALWNILEKGADQIKHGEKDATIAVTLSDGSKTLICSRRYTKSTSQISIVDSTGEKLTAKDIDNMLSDLSVNPHKIAKMKPKERVDTLLKSGGVGSKIEQIDEELEAEKQERLLYHRDMDGSKPGEEPEKAEKILASDLIERIEECQLFNKEITDANDNYGRLKTERIENEEKIMRLKEEIKGYEKLIEGIGSQMFTIKEKYGSIEFKEVDELKEELENIEAVNTKADEHNEWERRNAKYQKASRQHDAAQESIKNLQDQKKELLEGVELPLDGLTIEEGKLYYNECLFENLGHSEQMLVCAALAKEQIGEIRVVRMDGIESMSKEDFGKMKKIFNDADIQILASRVSRGEIEPDEIVIEEGLYKEN